MKTTQITMNTIRISFYILVLTAVISCEKVYTGPGYVVHSDKQAMDFAWRSFDTNDYSQARKMANVGLNINPESSDACTLLGLIDMREGNYTQAVSWIEKSLVIARKDTVKYNIPVTLINLGFAYLGVKAYDKAQQVFYESFNTKSYSASILGLAISEYKRSDLERALDVLKSITDESQFRYQAKNLLKLH
jgi:tetratricopeptide (TPR) repeat protein